MYARIITTQLQPSAIDEAIRRWREKVVPTLQDAKGFRSGYMTGDRATGKGVVFSLWESEADASAMSSSGKYQEAIGHFADLFTAPPTQEQCEVFIEV